MVDKKDLHSKIEALYPADDRDSVIAETGQRLFINAIGDWRNLPDEILMKYLAMCQLRDRSRRHYTTVKYRN